MFKPLVVSSILLTTGCASMFNGTKETMYIRSNVDDAKLYVNEAYIGKESGVSVFHKSKEYVITARKDGCEDVTIPVSKSFDATTLLGLFIDYGIFTILLIDGAANGAWQDFDQTSYVVDPHCSPEKLADTRTIEPKNGLSTDYRIKRKVKQIIVNSNDDLRNELVKGWGQNVDALLELLEIPDSEREHNVTTLYQLSQGNPDMMVFANTVIDFYEIN